MIERLLPGNLRKGYSLKGKGKGVAFCLNRRLNPFAWILLEHVLEHLLYHLLDHLLAVVLAFQVPLFW